MNDRAILIAWIETLNIWRSSSESNYQQYNDATDNCKKCWCGKKSKQGKSTIKPSQFLF